MDNKKRALFILSTLIFVLKYCSVCALTWDFKPVTDPNDKSIMGGAQWYSYFGDENAAIKVSNDAKFYTTPVAIIDGTIERETTGEIQGEFWFGTHGAFKKNRTNIGFKGYFFGTDSPTYVLNGSGAFLNTGPNLIDEPIIVDGSGKITGQPIFSNTITLSFRGIHQYDDVYLYMPSSLNLGIQSSLNKNIVLNFGTILLEDDLRLADDVIFDGSGTVSLNGYKITLGGSDLLWNGNLYWNNAAILELNSTQTLTGTWIFDSNAHVVGNNQIIDLSSGGSIIVESAGTSLLLDNVTIKGLSGTNMRCLDDSCTISLRNVRLILDHDYTFDKGSISISDKVVIEGQHSYKYMTNRQSIISADACLALEPGATFHYEPSTAQKNLITMTDQSAEIFLNGATLSTSTTGLQLTKGTITIDGKSSLCNDEAQSLSQGFVIGDGTSEGEVTINIKPGATLDLVSGSLDYKNT